MPILGIDIGGSGIKGALVDIDTGELVAPRVRYPTPESAKPNDVAVLVAKLAAPLDYSGPIGCGFPSVVMNGVVMTAANIDQDWIGLNADDLFAQVTNCPTYVLNDADAAGMAEMKFGAGKDYQKGVVLLLTLGTGIGTAIFTDGQLLPNLEFGHLKIRDKDAEKRAADSVRQRKNLSWQEYAERLQEYLNEMERLFWPDLIVIGGGISKESEKFLQYIKLRTKIVPAQLLNQAGIIGAALYAYKKSSTT
ncbi:MAG TPA: ROK family protein [Anaerolineaceae bacterium]|nr:ROK family protein [Anaerolineaceae bacterium]